MAGIRGKRSIWPPTREKAGKMFSGTDYSEPHKGLREAALKPSNNLGGMKNSVKAADEPNKRHQAPRSKSA